jgi:FMN reductase
MTTIAAVLGSVTPPGRLSSAIDGALERGAVGGHQMQLFDLGSLRLDFADGRPPSEHDDDSAFVIEAISRADAVLLASPVYRGSFTGALKNLLDLLPVESLQGKPVGIVAMGATQHHFLGVDFHLREVLTWFGALVAPSSVYLTSTDFVDGKLAPAAAEQLDGLVQTIATLAAATGGLDFGPTPFAARRP